MPRVSRRLPLPPSHSPQHFPWARPHAGSRHKNQGLQSEKTGSMIHNQGPPTRVPSAGVQDV